MTRREQLARLIREQARDDAGDRQDGVRLKVRTVYGLDLDRLATPTASRLGRLSFAFLHGTAWDRRAHDAAIEGKGPCQVCGGGPLRRTEYCLGCDRCALDGKVVYPGLDAGELMDEDYAAATRRRVAKFVPRGLARARRQRGQPG